MKKIITFSLFSLLSIAVSCNKDYTDRINALKDRAAVLHEADNQTRKILTDEMTRLSDDVDDMLAAMEDRVLTHLDEMVRKVEAEILDQSISINLSIKRQSDAIGGEIVAWRNNLDGFITKNTSMFEKSRADLQTNLTKAINQGNSNLVARIRKSLRNLDSLEGNFTSYVQGIQKRIDYIKNLESLYKSTTKAVDELKWRKEDMLATMDDYEAKIRVIVREQLDATTNRALSDAVDAMIDLYEAASLLYDESSSYLEDIDDFYSNMPDIDGFLSEATDLISQCSLLENNLDEIDESRIEDIMDYLAEAVEAADAGDVTFSDVEGIYDEVNLGMQDFLEQTNELISQMDDSISIMEDKINEVEEYIAKF